VSGELCEGSKESLVDKKNNGKRQQNRKSRQPIYWRHRVPG